MTPRALILDLDGTLIDSRPGILSSFRVAVNAVFPGREFDPATVVLGPPIRQMFHVSFPQSSEDDRDKLVRAFREHYDTEGSLKTQLYGGARTVLTACRERAIDLYIATNKPARISSAILAHFRIADYFKEVLAADSIDPPFSNKAAIIRHLLREFEIGVSSAIYVGDSVEDSTAAGECEVPFIWASYGYGKVDLTARPTYGVIETLGELTGFLDEK